MDGWGVVECWEGVGEWCGRVAWIYVERWWMGRSVAGGMVGKRWGCGRGVVWKACRKGGRVVGVRCGRGGGEVGEVGDVGDGVWEGRERSGGMLGWGVWRWVRCGGVGLGVGKMRVGVGWGGIGKEWWRG